MCEFTWCLAEKSSWQVQPALHTSITQAGGLPKACLIQSASIIFTYDPSEQDKLQTLVPWDCRPYRTTIWCLHTIRARSFLVSRPTLPTLSCGYPLPSIFLSRLGPLDDLDNATDPLNEEIYSPVHQGLREYIARWRLYSRVSYFSRISTKKIEHQHSHSMGSILVNSLNFHRLLSYIQK